MKKLLTKVAALALVLAMCFSLAACGGASAPATTEAAPAAPAAATTNEDVPTLKIGYLGTLSGGNATTGQQSLWGAQMIVDIINNESDVALMLAKDAGLPNLNGAKVELIVGDNKGETETMASECRRLIEEGCCAICGQFTSAGTMTCATLCEQYGIPLVTCASAVYLTDGSKDYEWYIRPNPNDGTFITDSLAMLKEMNDDGKEIKTIALFNENSEFGMNIQTIENQYAADYGFEVVEDVIFTPSSTSLSTEVMKLQAAKPDAVLASAVATSDVILFMNTMKDLNFYPKAMVGQRGGFSVDDFRTALGKDCEYAYTTSGGALDIDKACLPELQDLYLKYADEGYILTESIIRDVMNLILIAVAANQAGSYDPADIKDAFYNLDVDMDLLPVAWEDFELDQYGQNIYASGVVQQIQDGNWVTVYPRAVASKEAVCPAPGWNER